MVILIKNKGKTEMISNFLIDTFGRTTYVTFVITVKNGSEKLEFIPPVSNRLKSLLKSAGLKFYSKACGNPKAVECIKIEDVVYYFSVQRIRHGADIHYGIHVLYAMTEGNEMLFSPDYNMSHILHVASSDPIFENISDKSRQLIEKLRKNTSLYEYLFDFYSFRLNGFFENNKESYFYRINDVIKYTVEHYFDKENCPREFCVKFINSDMYTQINLNHFMFFMVNLFLTVIKYSQGTVDIGFRNNLKTLDITASGKFTDGFFQDNDDITHKDEWLLSPRHPAFSDFEFIKALANKVGAAVNLDNPVKDSFEICVSVSKIDIVYSNILRVNKADADASNIPIYTVDVDDIIN